MDREKGTVLLLPSGQELVPGPGQSILDAALDAGVNLPRSCRSGNCGTCVARLVEGRVRYPDGRPMGLTLDEEREGKVLLCQARPVGRVLVEASPVSRAGQAQVKRLPCRVESLSLLTGDVMGMRLRLPSVEPLEFEPGQYLTLTLPGSQSRNLSIANSPSQTRLLDLYIDRVANDEFSQIVFGELKPGTVLRLEGAFGDFTLQPSSRPWLMLACDTGIAPIKSMLDWALEQGEPRPIRLFWGLSRSADDYAGDTLSAYLRDIADFYWEPVFLHEGPGQDWLELALEMQRAVARSISDLWGYDIYLSGPRPLVAAVRTALEDAGANPASLFFESIEPEPHDGTSPVPPAIA
jgi:CDP-4-dehydro-6-deoxyglucose reductase